METKLLVAFLAMVALLVVLGAVGLGVLGDAHRRSDELIRLERKIAAYRQVQQDTTAQLYGVSSALLASNDRALSAVLRQLERFGYDLERLQFIAKDEPALSEPGAAGLRPVRGRGHAGGRPDPRRQGRRSTRNANGGRRGRWPTASNA